MLFHLTNAEYEVSILAFDDKVTKFDTTYFGYVKILNYRTWCYFTKTQLDFIATLFTLSKSTEALKNYTSGVHFSRKKAMENKYYLNTFLFNFINGYESKRLKYMNPNFFRDYLFGPWKQHSFYQWYLSDREEVVFTEKVHFPLQKLKKKLLLKSTIPTFVNECANINELMTNLLPEGEVPSEFFTEFKTFFLRHKLHYSHSHYEVNWKLINICRFLRLTFTMNEVKNFKTYHKLISYAFKNYRCFSLFVEGRHLSQWDYCFTTLCGENKIKTFLKWEFYAGRIEEMKEVLENLAPLKIPFTKFDDPVYSFNFFSKRYAQNTSNLHLTLANPNRRFEHQYETDITLLSLAGLEIKLVTTFKELMDIGLKLHNCAGNEETKENYLKTFNFVVSKNGEPLYLGTLRKGEFSQFKGFKNSAPPIALFQELNIQLKEKGFTTSLETYKEVCVQSYH